LFERSRKMSVIDSHVDAGSIRTILALGCGTGRFSEGLANRFGARVVSVDPSEKMLEQARRKRHGNGIHYERGPAEAIQLVDGAVDMIHMRQEWEHKVVETKDRTALQPELASAGAEGWELVSATAMFNTLMTKVVYTLFLKRPVS
jgi:SAM-dependent methyltransferase